MTSTIITKHSAVLGLAPSAGQLVEGELAVNVTDRKLYTLNDAGDVVIISHGANFDEPISIVVNSSSPGIAVTQTGTGGGIDVTVSSSGVGLLVNKSGSGDAFRVTNTGSGNSFVVEDSSNPDSTPFVIDASGNVLIGTPTSNSAFGGKLQYEGTSVDASFVRYSASTGGPYMYFGKSRGATIGTNTIVASGDTIGTLYWNGADGTNYIPAASISAQVDGTPGTNDMPGRLVFSTTADGASTPTERLRINSSGAYGIAGANFGTAGQAMISAGSAAAPAWTTQYLAVAYVISGGGSVITTGIKGDLTIPFNCVIDEWTILADQTGSIVVDIWKDTYANYPPTIADTITASAKPTVSAAVKGQSSTLTGWTTTVTAGDTLRFNVDSCSSITRITLSLKVHRT